MSVIKGPNVYLRPPVPEDAKLWNLWLNDYDIVLPLGDEVYGKVTEASIKKQIEDYVDSDYFLFTIVTNFDKPIGRCMLFGVDRINAKGMVGIFLGDKNEWGKGYAREAFELLVEYSFRIQNMHSIALGVYEFNNRAIDMYKKIGFTVIGTKRDARKINGKYVNIVLMDILENEYENKYFDFSDLE
jgi:RimJ/RimL family protein N-acetyltransferase